MCVSVRSAVEVGMVEWEGGEGGVDQGNGLRKGKHALMDDFSMLRFSTPFQSSLCPPPSIAPPFPPLLEVSLVPLDGLLDAQQQGSVPLVQAGDGVKLLHLEHGQHNGL